MRYFAQYHSFEQLGYLPSMPDHVISINSSRKLPLLQTTISNTKFLIVGKKVNGFMRYYLWSTTITKEISAKDANGQYHARGPQVVFQPG